MSTVTSSIVSQPQFRTGASAYGLRFDPLDRKPLPARSTDASLMLRPEDLTQLRFAFSPLWECVAACRFYINPNARGLFSPWYDRIQAAVSKAGGKYLSEVFGPHAAIPEIFAPWGRTPCPSLQDELSHLLSLPDDLVRTEIKMAFPSLPASFAWALKKPSEALRNFAEILETIWVRVVAPDWTLLRAKLESELLYRARALAVTGLTGLFEGLHHDLSFSGNRLTVRGADRWDARTRESGLLIVPSVFSWPDLFFRVRPPWQPTIVYPCRGLAELWDESVHPPAALEKLIGRSCARIIQFLTSPRTTHETAAAVRLSTAAASEQITKLWRAGVLERTRIGTRVFYSLNAKGTALVKAFSR